MKINLFALEKNFLTYLPFRILDPLLEAIANRPMVILFRTPRILAFPI